MDALSQCDNKYTLSFCTLYARSVPFQVVVLLIPGEAAEIVGECKYGDEGNANTKNIMMAQKVYMHVSTDCAYTTNNR